MDDSLRKDKQRWDEQTLSPVLAQFPERRQRFETSSEIEVERLYLPQELDYGAKLGFPGDFPFTRGVQPTMYRGRLWTMRQYAGYASAGKGEKVSLPFQPAGVKKPIDLWLSS